MASTGGENWIVASLGTLIKFSTRMTVVRSLLNKKNYTDLLLNES